MRICVLRFTGYQQAPWAACVGEPTGGPGLLPAGSLKAINAILGHIEPILVA